LTLKKIGAFFVQKFLSKPQLIVVVFHYVLCSFRDICCFLTWCLFTDKGGPWLSRACWQPLPHRRVQCCQDERDGQFIQNPPIKYNQTFLCFSFKKQCFECVFLCCDQL
jgi:hypothetical protein